MQSTVKNSFYGSEEEKAVALSRVAESASYFNMDDLSLELFQDANKHAPYHLDIKLKLGVHLLKINDVNNAKKTFKEIIVLYPYHKQALSNLGYVSMLENDFINARIYLQKSIDLDPDYLQAYENLFMLSKLESNNQDLKKYMQRIIEIKPSYDIKKLKSLMN